MSVFNYTIKTIRESNEGGSQVNSVPAGLLLSHGTQLVASQSLVVSAKFKGMPPLQRHQLMNGFLAKELLHIYTYEQKTLTLDQWSHGQRQDPC
uniref:Uncharacterized protein n=1 Tax=Spermophilus dauricus TaxID=99837 RepID=A0A8C9PM40_SPEDA